MLDSCRNNQLCHLWKVLSRLILMSVVSSGVDLPRWMRLVIRLPLLLWCVSPLVKLQSALNCQSPPMRKNNYDNYQMSSTQSNWFIYHFMALARLLIIFRPSFRSENGRFSSSAQCFIRCKIKGAISIRARCRWKGVTSRYLSFKPEQRCNLKGGRDGLERSVNF